MFTMLKKNRKVTSLLIVLFLIVIFHFILLSLYVRSYDYVEKNYQDAGFQFFSYATTLCAILGIRGLIGSKTISMRSASLVLILPSILIYIIIMTLFINVFRLDGNNSYFTRFNYYDYLSAFPFIINTIIYIITISILIPSKDSSI